MDALPHWEPGTAAVLVTGDAHAIPVSTCVRAGDRRVLLALGRHRRALELLRETPTAAVCVLAEGAAFTAAGSAAVVRDPLEAAGTAVAVELQVERIQDHLADGRTEMLGAADWRWRDERAAADEPRILAELEELARAGD